LHSALTNLCRVPQPGTRQTITVTVFAKVYRSWQRGTVACVARDSLCRVPYAWHSAKVGLPSVCNQALGKANLCRVLNFCRVAFGKHSSNCIFAKCSISCTRQSLQHSANIGFPVVSRRFVLHSMVVGIYTSAPSSIHTRCK